MGETTLTVSDSTVERLDNYRDDSYGSWDRTLNAMMNMVPTVEKMNEGCDWCEDAPLAHEPPDERSGIIEFFVLSYPGGESHESRYYCSTECLEKQQEEIDKQVPTLPDTVYVGGRAEIQADFGDATFHIDADTREVIVPVPGAFSGYEEEPVYIENGEGEIVQSGVVEEVIHEDAITALILGYDAMVEALNHPDEERRNKWQENEHRPNYTDCDECGQEAAYAEDPPSRCPFCGAGL